MMSRNIENVRIALKKASLHGGQTIRGYSNVRYGLRRLMGMV